MIRKYWVFIRMCIANSFIDRGDILLYSLSLFTTPIIILAVWLVINTEGSNTLMSRNDLIVYFLANVLVGTIRSSWYGQFLPGRIRRGEISSILLKPQPFLIETISNNIAEKIIKLSFLIPMVVFLGYWLSAKVLSQNILIWVLIVLTTLLAAIIFFLLDVIIGMLAFWFEETRSIQELIGVFESLFSGRFIPLVILPLFWKDLANLLPFRYMASLPLEILLGQLNNKQMIGGTIVQVGYLILVIITYKFISNRGFRRYGASGA